MKKGTSSVPVFIDIVSKLSAVTSVNGLALVLLGAGSGFLYEIFDALVESLQEIATGAHVHLGEHLFYTGCNNGHNGIGKK